MDLKDLLTVREFCDIVGISPSRVSLMIKFKQLSPLKKGNIYLIPFEETKHFKTIQQKTKTIRKKI